MKKLAIIGLLLIMVGGNGCQVLTEVAAFTRCTFDFEKISDVKLAAVDIQKANSLTSLSFTEIGKITSAILSKELYLDMTAQIKVTNPNAQKAAMDKLEWILLIDGVEITRGTTTERVEVPANGSGYLPVHTNFNLATTFSGQSKDALWSLARNIAGFGDKPSKVVLRVKPSITVSGILLVYPGWLDLTHKVGETN